MRHLLHWCQAASNWLLCSKYLIQDNTKAEYVSLLCTSACRDQLWRHPVEGASILQRDVTQVVTSYVHDQA